MQANPAFMQMAIDLATENVTSRAGGPFGAVVVREGKVIATGVNSVTANNDPTAHAEVMALREACRVLETFELTGCDVYTSCEPCPMCLAAIYWSRCAAIYFGNTAADAANAGFDDSFLYAEVQKPLEDRTIPTSQLLPELAIVSFNTWCELAEKIEY